MCVERIALEEREFEERNVATAGAAGGAQETSAGVERLRAAVEGARTFVVHTLGCKVNQAESELIARWFMAVGLEDAGARGHEAAAVRSGRVDVLCVNTCVVTGEAEAKSRKAIRHLVAKLDPRVVVIAGCGAARIRAQVRAEGREVIALENEEKREVVGAAARAALARPARGGPRRPPSSPTRAFLKIQDGCNRRCSYCIVPLERGPERSVPLREIIARAEELAEAGVPEVVLCGVHLGRYGAESGSRAASSSTRASSRVHDARANDEPRSLAELLDLLARRFSFRIRLSSIDVEDVTEELIEVVARNERICPHFHIPLQSGSDRILAAMGRPYTRERFLETIHRLRERIPDAAISTDVMVGFPGETDEDFEQTISAIENARFMRLHVFRFSARPGTRAATLPDRVSAATMRARSERVIERSALLEASFMRGLDGKVLEVVIEEHREGRDGATSVGRSQYYVPVEIPGRLPKGSLVRVRARWLPAAREHGARAAANQAHPGDEHEEGALEATGLEAGGKVEHGILIGKVLEA
jgi:threonylcarbamoyladenosine tRNA methylthiotransferase MtaB